jgi:hypothetical protein
MPQATDHPLNVLINGKGLIEASIDYDVEQIDVTASVEPDPNWTFLDSAGHMHAYTKKGNLPTLKAEQREIVCTDPDHDDDCEGYWITEYHCRICSELIEPKMREATSRKYMPGRASWEVRFKARMEDGFALYVQDHVSVWTQDGHKVVHFGVGQLLVHRVNSEGFADGVVVGIGELGRR